MPSSTDDQWFPFYDQAIDGQPDHQLSHGPTGAANGHDQLTPKGSVSKPARRRSRASKRTPTTLLNANANNFRALVQQFTGCPSAAISFGNYQKGPVNLDFGRGRDENQRIISSLMTTAPFSYPYHQQSQAQAQPQQYQQVHDQVQQQQSMYTRGNNIASDGFVSASGDGEIGDGGFAVDDNVSLQYHQIRMDSFSGDAKSDGFF